MKKNLFMAALALAAGTAFAAAQTDYSGVYSGELTVSLGASGTPAAQNILFDVLNARYGKKSTVIVSQKLPDAWLEMLGGSALAESIVERAGNNNYTLILKGDSRRSSLD